MDRELKLVVFKLMEDEYGFEIDRVREIRRIRRITRIAQAPAFVEGVIKLRGNVVPVVDLRKRLGLPAKEYGKSTRLIIVNVEGSRPSDRALSRGSAASEGSSEAASESSGSRSPSPKAEGHTLGIAVDSVTDVLTVPPEKIDYPDSILATAVFLKAVAKVPGRMVLVADVEKILTLEEKELLVKPAAGKKSGQGKNYAKSFRR